MIEFREGSDALLRFKLQVTEEGITTDVVPSEFGEILLEMSFSDSTKREVIGNIQDDGTVTFDIYSEFTKGKVGPCKIDIWGRQDAKRVRFNRDTIKGTVLVSVKVPNVLQNS